MSLRVWFKQSLPFIDIFTRIRCALQTKYARAVRQHPYCSATCLFLSGAQYRLVSTLTLSPGRNPFFPQGAHVLETPRFNPTNGDSTVKVEFLEFACPPIITTCM